MREALKNASLTRRSALPCVLAIAVSGLAVAVTGSATISRLDAILSEAALSSTFAPVAAWSFAITTLGGTTTALPIAAMAVVALAAARHWRGALTVALAVAATQPVVELIKMAVERPRPSANGHLAEAAGHSFPSAHSATSMALYAGLALIAAHASRGRARVAIVCVGAALVAAVGLTRIHLGAHYPLDVLAGWLTGGALVLAAWAVASRLPAPRLGRAQAY